jgi:SNF2 family DNA or RNA helicase
MTLRIDIDTDQDRQRFILYGSVNELTSNPRAIFSLKRLNFDTEDGGAISVPFEDETEIDTLREIQKLLERFSFSVSFSKNTANENANYVRAEETFDEFSNNARRIRNNHFRDYPNLAEDFRNFIDVLAKKIVRPLYPRQLLSAFHMAFSQHACNFAVPGAGKTSIVYGAYTYLKSLPEDDPKRVDKLLVIGPLSSFAPWESEFEECFGYQVSSQRLSGDPTLDRRHKEQHLFSTNPAELTLIFHGGVEGLRNEVASFLRRNRTMVVIDEAHRIKNPDGVWGRSVVEIAKDARSRIILTGTPVPNGYEDLYNLFQFLYPYRFKRILQVHYGNLVEMTKNSELDSQRVARFTNNISPFFIRINKTDLDLPPYHDHIIDVVMDPVQREIYDFIETNYVRSFQADSSATVGDILNRARLIRLRQAATNPSLLLKPIAETLSSEDYESRIPLGGSIPDEFPQDSQILQRIRNYKKNHRPEKFKVAAELISQITARQEKVIVWTIFIQNAKELREFLETMGLNVELLIGEVPQEQREKVVKTFNDPENFDFPVVIANPFSVAESISLHKGCHSAIYVERDYNCSNFLQSKDRIHRYGLPEDQHTNYYYLIARDSIDGVIDERLNHKILRMERIIDDEIPLFTRLNDSDETDLITGLLDDYARRTKRI